MILQNSLYIVIEVIVMEEINTHELEAGYWFLYKTHCHFTDNLLHDLFKIYTY